jgi:hypothetical protein
MLWPLHMDREKAGIDHTVLRATRAGVDRPDRLVQCAGGVKKRPLPRGLPRRASCMLAHA